MKENECRNIFMNGRREPTREHFTKVWAGMINGIERGKAQTTVKK